MGVPIVDINHLTVHTHTPCNDGDAHHLFMMLSARFDHHGV